MKYVVLAVASDVEADRLIEDLTENPGMPLRTPHWGNAVHATVPLGVVQQRAAELTGRLVLAAD
ncbi:MAG TPA: hypothetical protein VGH99_12735 [Pseudonocardia sp.]|jgi:hypothetical protein